jgi:hypothetical protein
VTCDEYLTQSLAPLAEAFRAQQDARIIAEATARFAKCRATDAAEKAAAGIDWDKVFDFDAAPLAGTLLRIRMPDVKDIGRWGAAPRMLRWNDKRHPGPYDTIGLSGQKVCSHLNCVVSDVCVRCGVPAIDQMRRPPNPDAAGLARAMRNSRQNLAMYERER